MPSFQPLGAGVYQDGQTLSKDPSRKGLSSTSRCKPLCVPLLILFFHLSALQRVQGVLCSLCPQEMQLKLALVQSVTEVSSAIQTVGDAGSFELSSKQEVTQTLLVSACSRDSHTGELWAALSPDGRWSLGFTRAPGAVS